MGLFQTNAPLLVLCHDSPVRCQTIWQSQPQRHHPVKPCWFLWSKPTSAPPVLIIAPSDSGCSCLLIQDAPVLLGWRVLWEWLTYMTLFCPVGTGFSIWYLYLTPVVRRRDLFLSTLLFFLFLLIWYLSLSGWEKTVSRWFLIPCPCFFWLFFKRMW